MHGVRTVSKPFAEYDGTGVTVAVIDSGVNVGHPHITAMPRGFSVGPGDEDDGHDFSDQMGHGTAVMAAIQEKAPGARYLAIRVFDGSLRTSTEVLLKAIYRAVHEGADVVNLSLGTPRMEYREAFEKAVSEAARFGTLIVAARESREGPCLPGALPAVLGAALDWECPRDGYRVQIAASGSIVLASGYPRPLPGRPVERNVSGISFATANLTGIAVRARQATGVRSIDELTELLAAGVVEVV